MITLIIADELKIAEIRLDEAKIENERRYKLDLTKFITDNSTTIFNGTLEEQERMKNIMFFLFQ